MKVAIVGATGLVGEVMRTVLEERHFPVTELLAVASERSVGSSVTFRGDNHPVISLADAVSRSPDVALFSAGGQVALDWAPAFAEAGAVVIDNSSAWRMDPDTPLIVPEVNAAALLPGSRIIANPNCSTIQLVVALAPLHRAFGIKRLVISTYQSVTGTGVRALRQYDAEKEGRNPSGEERAYPHPIFDNVLPHCDAFLENAYTKEEMKLVNETRKILGDPHLRITATAVRVPVHGGHSESVNIETERPFDMQTVRNLLAAAQGLVIQDDLAANQYPMPLKAKHHDEVFVGRIRRDESIDNGLNLWVVADNLRKGAATNAIQIAEYLLKQGKL
ncbi:MAG: aspartate-semialdehyde dehydrogenase [Saprospiraceae bacterium]|jgi:aspartate-semialdehyde dehydrogenase